MSNGTVSELLDQWKNPSDITTILMVIGGDVVQNAFAQGTGKLYTPVCFSFGCVTYAFISLVNLIGEGRLMPRADYPSKVINLETGYARENKNWVLGRLLRDIETDLARGEPLGSRTGIRISVYDALENKNGLTESSWCFMHLVGVIATVLQFVIAAIPIFFDHQWSIMLVTVAGTVFTQITGSLPQWRAEKLPNRQKSKKVYAITSGNGSRDIVVIRGMNLGLDLEEMSSTQSPRTNRPWEKFSWLSTADEEDPSKKCQQVKTLRGLPLGFRLTQITCSVLSILWLFLLVNVAASKEYTWCMIGVGTVGMFQNAWLAAVEVAPKYRNLPIVRVDNITRHKVMDAIMDFEATYGLGSPLRDEFFPGDLRQEEIKWWQADRRPYDEAREKKSDSRQWPRSNENCAGCVRVRESLAKSKCVPLCPEHAVQSRSMRK